MREIVLDTETTGTEPEKGDRLVEIGCVELWNHVATGRTYHVYLNPERDMPEEAFRIHGLSTEFLRAKPLFSEVVGDFLDFIAMDRLVIHNASFDMGFLNAELRRLGMKPLANPVLDTVQMARRRFPGAPASLDALCRRFEIDNSNRTLHGALLDSELLAEVYLELLGGRQPDLVLAGTEKTAGEGGTRVERRRRDPRPHAPLAEEEEAHRAFVTAFKTPALWLAEQAKG
ncbi:MAG: polymerase epsilon subunit [Pseudomonadota bacterium]|jgi:DNA polymerase-3 subunit epsilon